MTQTTTERDIQEFITKIGIKNSQINYNFLPEELEEEAVLKGQAIRTQSGAIAINTGEFTGRSPKDRFIVKDEITRDKVWWGDINIPFSSEKFDLLYKKVTDYLSEKEIYVRDAKACASPQYSLNIRAINEYPWSNLFIYNMFIRPEEDELDNFTPDWLIINAPGFNADPEVDGTRKKNFAILNFKRKIALIGGTGYTGEMKKGIFSALNFILPTEHNVLSMHCSANIGKKGDTALFFGLSGTGKTTLSADPERVLIGDDEHGWSDDDSIFNFEGGCYAKTINLSMENEPDIYNAIKQGALLENIGFFPETNTINFEDSSITQNTRVSYPIHHIEQIAQPSMGGSPKNIFFLTCDAYGVLPPISKLTPGQAAFHFISGYTAKIAGTEEGINEPVTVFSACFGEPFMPLHPTYYAKMLSQKIKENKANVWLVNTGWSGGSYGTGKRMKLPITRSLISSALNGELDNVDFTEQKIFGLQMPTSCPGVPSDVLNPRNTWMDKSAYESTKIKLAKEFIKNFNKYIDESDEETIQGAPKI